ncbi:NADH-quinone oxidoreductase subunit L [Ignatzschineria indica]|uniref:NADH-quinone oxidoreductase subunit L n=1 Tax=Ignatzschineria indica TaxID=472583 RepID=UPI002575F0E6|nr:NADH-quinone oxidoreductase subunit L [Ignatzschineria indica]MDM1545304.1 NADH-quinone oxidoreductase subunit L [Ignatzschineria indica]
MDLKYIYLLIVLLPLFGSIISGLFCRVINEKVAHTVTIVFVAIAALLSGYVLIEHMSGRAPIFDENIYTWMDTGSLSVGVGFLVDNLTAMMMVVITSVSTMVHLYSVGYMKGDPGYNRFFSYISLFTFSMLMLVMSNNFMQLFFGWEAVGLVSYLLIGFWFKKPTATYANMKAFLVNRVGDFGFLIGIACVAYMTSSLTYTEAFDRLPEAAGTLHFLGTDWNIMTFAAVFLFIGAMGKSAQVPLHVWLPDSMEGPTPISALIHAATMVTAGIFMVARMSPIYELSTTALSMVMILGAITALFMGVLGLFQNDIKRVIAYSTISQLGYMTVALGASAYSLAAFHLTTHAFFKALLFLGAGSVIIGMSHVQDMRFMGGLRKKMPITWITTLIGSLALVGMPFFSGYYSKEGIIWSLEHSSTFGSGFAHLALEIGVFMTALYTFRMYFLVFHGKARYTVDESLGHDHHSEDESVLPETPKESPWVVTLPLILLAIPSVILGWYMAPMMFENTFLADSVYINNAVNPATEIMKQGFEGSWAMTKEALTAPAFYLTLLGIAVAWYSFLIQPKVAAKGKEVLEKIGLYRVFENKYYFDDFNQKVIANGSVGLGRFFWQKIDDKLIDRGIVFGAAHVASFVGGVIRRIQTGYIYHAAFLMVVGLLALMTWVVFFN